MVLAWSDALNRNDNEGAASYFAPGAIIRQSQEYRLDDAEIATTWNDGLPCAGKIVELRMVDIAVVAIFVLGERPGHQCDAPGAARRRGVRDRGRADPPVAAGRGARRGHADHAGAGRDGDRHRTRRVTARRAVRLFAAYRGPVALVCGLIIITAVIGMAPAFLLRDLLDNVLVRGEDLDVTRLNLLVAGMVAVPIVTGIIGVWQTWLANRIGQQVMHDLRVSVYTHLQRLPLAFFTRTRTGEVQSRIANDIGGVQAVVTSTATSIAQNATTVIAATAAMLVLSWPLTVASFILLPFFALATRRVGDRRAGASRRRSRARWPTSRRWSRSRCRCRACCWRRRWARAAS